MTNADKGHCRHTKHRHLIQPGATGKDAKEEISENKQKSDWEEKNASDKGTACAVIRPRCGEYQENNQ